MQRVGFMSLSTNQFDLPKYETKGAAGMDIKADKDVVVYPGEVVRVPTGFAVELALGWELQVRPRSGISIKYPNYIANSPGTIDSDFKGEVMVIVVNNTKDSWVIKQGDRIAQLVLQPTYQARPYITTKLSTSARGAGGFGSTGK